MFITRRPHYVCEWSVAQRRDDSELSLKGSTQAFRIKGLFILNRDFS